MPKKSDKKTGDLNVNSFNNLKEQIFNDEKDDKMSNKLLRFKRLEYIEKTIWDFFDKINNSQDEDDEVLIDKDKVYEELLEYAKDEMLLHYVLLDIKEFEPETTEDVLLIIETTINNLNRDDVIKQKKDDNLKKYKQKEKLIKKEEKVQYESIKIAEDKIDKKNENSDLLEKLWKNEESYEEKVKELDELIKEIEVKKAELVIKKSDKTKNQWKKEKLIEENEELSEDNEAMFKVNNKFREKFKELVEGYKKDDKLFFATAVDLYENNLNQYKKFKSIVIQINATFRDRFELEIEPGLLTAKQKIALWTDDIELTSILDNTLCKKQKDWLEIEVWAEGRKLLFNWNTVDWYIDNIPNIKKVIEVENSLKEALTWINMEVDWVFLTLAFINEILLNETDISAIEEKIRLDNDYLYSILNFNMWVTAKDIKYQLLNIKKQLLGFNIKREEEKTKIIKEKRWLVDSIILDNKSMADEADKEKVAQLKV